MNRMNLGSTCSRSVRRIGALVLFSGCVLYAATASATLLSFSGTSIDGHAVSGTANITLGAGTATIVLTNTTTTTHDAGELLTGIDFSLGGATLALATKTGIERTVAGNGTFTDTGSAQNLTWSLNAQGSGNYQLDFSPDASDAILGPPSGGNYAGANSSIDGNNGHNPFGALTATFTITGNALTANTPINVTHFLYGTGPDPATGTITPSPEPSTLVLMCLGLATLALRKRR
jgi:PEP-CTERM motif